MMAYTCNPSALEAKRDQVLVEWLKQQNCLPSKHEGLSSNPIPPKKKKGKKKRV
jgi:hypothetical protein